MSPEVRWSRAAREKVQRHSDPEQTREMANGLNDQVKGRNPTDIASLIRFITAQAAGSVRTKHPGSKRGVVHTPRVGGGNVHRAVTRPRRNSWNHLKKLPGPVWMHRSR